jgi:hypothetical protein
MPAEPRTLPALDAALSVAQSVLRRTADGLPGTLDDADPLRLLDVAGLLVALANVADSTAERIALIDAAGLMRQEAFGSPQSP